MKPKTFGHLVSNVLYEKRFGPYFVEPVIAGLDTDGKPFITATDCIGAAVATDDFVVAGKDFPFSLQFSCPRSTH
jgi:20S proteasome subunit beta 3